jgi:hypothetical protein
MARPRLRSVPGRAPGSGGHRGGHPKEPHDRLTVTLHLLGLHRRKREVIRAIGDHVEQLEALVSLCHMVSTDTFSDDPGEELRASSTMMRAASREMMSTTIELATRLGELRFMAHLESITIEEPEG